MYWGILQVVVEKFYNLTVVIALSTNEVVVEKFYNLTVVIALSTNV